jgi:hypothetical protein
LADYPARAGSRTKEMLNKLGVIFAFLCFFAGTILLSDPISKPDTTQTAKVLGGAVLFSVGLVTISLVAREWWEWKKFKNYTRKSAPN